MKKLFLFMTMALLSFGAFAKTMVVLGDSYSAHRDVIPQGYASYYPVFYSSTGVQSVDQMWYSLVANKMKYTLGSVNAWSGSTICNTGYGGQDFSNQSFISRINKLGTADVIFILGGTNDAWANSPIGKYKYASWTNEDLATFRPAMAFLLDGLQKKYPQAKIFFILNNDLKEEIDESVKTVCKEYKVPVIELKDIEKEAAHPTLTGMKQIADQVVKVVKRH